MRQLNDAETEIVTALALNNDEEYQLIHAIILYRKGNYAKAINILTKLSETLQTSDVFKYLGFSYLGKKEYSNAMLNLDKAIILTNDDKELNQKYNETRELIKNINITKLQEEERQEVRNIYEDKPEPKTVEPEKIAPMPTSEIKEEPQDTDNDKNNKKRKKKKKNK
jgi:tetratricopeptide (TPR) repeat protein